MLWHYPLMYKSMMGNNINRKYNAIIQSTKQQLKISEVSLHLSFSN